MVKPYFQDKKELQHSESIAGAWFITSIIASISLYVQIWWWGVLMLIIVVCSGIEVYQCSKNNKKFNNTK